MGGNGRYRGKARDGYHDAISHRGARSCEWWTPAALVPAEPPQSAGNPAPLSPGPRVGVDPCSAQFAGKTTGEEAGSRGERGRLAHYPRLFRLGIPLAWALAWGGGPTEAPERFREPTGGDRGPPVAAPTPRSTRLGTNTPSLPRVGVPLQDSLRMEETHTATCFLNEPPARRIDRPGLVLAEQPRCLGGECRHPDRPWAAHDKRKHLSLSRKRDGPGLADFISGTARRASLLIVTRACCLHVTQHDIAQPPSTRQATSPPIGAIAQSTVDWANA